MTSTDSRVSRRPWHMPKASEFITPPDGLITLELMDERGRLKHRTQAENSLSQHFRDALATQLRGQGDSVAIGFDQWGATTLGLDTDDVLNAPHYGPTLPRCYAQHRQFQRSIFLSDNSDALSPTWWFPLGLWAGAHLDGTYTGTNPVRGAVVLTQCQRRYDGVRFVVDFGLDFANGTIINSVGLAGLFFPVEAGYNHVFGWETLNVIGTNSSAPSVAGNAGNYSMCYDPTSKTAFWSLGNNGVTKNDLAISTSWATTAIRTVTGPTAATIGSPGAAASGIAILGSSMWLMDTLRLRRSVVPIDGTYTALNTYSPVTGFTDASCLGLCTDQTNLYALGSSKVFVINPATGAVTSSWAHNLTQLYGMVYDQTMQMIWLLGTPADITAYRPGVSSATGAYIDWAHNGSADIARVWLPYTTAGVKKSTGGLLNLYTTGIGPFHGMFLIDDANYRGFGIAGTSNWSGAISNGGVLGSRALVASPFTKDNTKLLRVTYDITFTGL